jgi:hypothetical protein
MKKIATLYPPYDGGLCSPPGPEGLRALSPHHMDGLKRLGACAGSASPGLPSPAITSFTSAHSLARNKDGGGVASLVCRRLFLPTAPASGRLTRRLGGGRVGQAPPPWRRAPARLAAWPVGLFCHGVRGPRRPVGPPHTRGPLCPGDRAAASSSSPALGGAPPGGARASARGGVRRVQSAAGGLAPP